MGEKAKYLLITIVSIAAFFVNNAVIVPDIMESRNIITAREMVYDGHWIVTTMNGDLRLEKPPLPTWFAAVAEIISPDDIAAQRAVAGIGALLLVLFFCRFSERILKMDCLLPAMLLCTCYNVILMGRTATWDIWCHAFMMGGIYYLCRGLMKEECSWQDFILTGVMTGLSIMSKGPVSLYALLLPLIISFAYIYRPSVRDKGKALAAAAVIALVVGGWWYAYIYAFHSDDMARVAAKESGSWFNHNTRPWWYYWKFFLESGVWSLLLLTSVFMPLIRCRSVYNRSREYLLPLMWMLVMLVLLSLLPEKKPRYLLPMLIPAAYTMGAMVMGWRNAFRERIAGTAEKYLFRVNASLIAVAVIALPVAAYIFLYKAGFLPMWMFVTLTFVCLVVVAWLFGATLRLRPQCMVRAVTLLFFFAECAVMPFLNGVINNPDRNSISATKEMEELKDLAFYRNAEVPMRIEMVYATGKKIRPLDFNEADSVMAKLPCVVITRDRVGEEMDGELLERIDTTYIGAFDDNPRPKGNRRYERDFIYNVTILKHKTK